VSKKGGIDMFRSRKEQAPPARPFEHNGRCPIARVDPGFQPVWNEIETGRWRRECQCGAEGWNAPADRRARLDPLDPQTSRHAPEWEFVGETDAAVLRVILRVRDGLGPGYWWAECGACSAGWPVPHFTEEMA
jgi:hypothetical protein